MLIIHPDPARRIDLPGAGPCPRPVDIDRTRTGFGNLVSLRVYTFALGVTIDGEAEEDEVFVVLMRGEAEIAVSGEGRETGAFALRREGGMRAVYLPPHASYRLSAHSDCDIAYARVAARETRFPATRGFAPAGDRLDIARHAVGMDLALDKVCAGQAVDPAEHGHLLERFLHIRADGAASITIAGQPLHDWDSVALGTGEHAALAVGAGTVEVLTIMASAKGHVPTEI